MELPHVPIKLVQICTTPLQQMGPFQGKPISYAIQSCFSTNSDFDKHLNEVWVNI